MPGLGLSGQLLIAACVVPWLVLELIFFRRMQARHRAGGQLDQAEGSGE